uniref:Uncharacterized protein n=1 Tax=Equus caballus TaxID=9796 RepID=A0A9L0SZZ9_HORSE
MMKGTFHQENITLINIYAPNTGAPKYIKQLLTDLKGEINSNTIIEGNLSTPLTSMDRSDRQKVSREIVDLNEPPEQMDLIDIYIEHSIEKQQNTHSSQVHMDHSQR